jgi:hypothetical protein
VALVSRLAALCGLALLALASPAAAGPPGSWTQVTNFSVQGKNTDDVSLARTGDGVLHILWAESTGKTLFNTRLSSDAQSVLGTSTVFQYGGSLNNSVVLLPAPGGSLRAFFAGLFAADQSHDGGMSTATSTNGVSWTVQGTLASEADGANEASPVYAAAGLGGTTFNNGTPLSIWGDSSPGASGYHVGTSPGTPDVRFGGTAAGTVDPEAATDSETGQVVIGWNDIDTGSVMVAPVQASQNPWFPPGAATSPPGANAIDTQHPLGMTGRSGGAAGVYVAYLRGGNPPANPAVWRFGANSATTLSNADARLAGVTAGPDGRLWAFWKEEDNSLHARRSATDAATWGADTEINPPPGTSTVWNLKGEGSAASCGGLDLVALVTANGGTANHQQRVLPGITLKKKVLNGNKGRKAKVRFTTLDAGDPIDAKVKVGKKSAETGNDGKVKMKIKRKLKTRKVKARASADCFAKSQKVKVKIKKLRPEFR